MYRVHEGFGPETRTAVAAVRSAARLCRRVREQLSPEVLSKKDKSPVTVADFGSQAVVCRALAQAFPGDSIIAEEDSTDLRTPANAAILEQVVEQVRALGPVEDQGVSSSNVCAWIDHGATSQSCKRFWTIDPIDGTKGFLRNEQYAVALALVVDGKVVLGALACPNLQIDPGSSGASSGVVFLAGRGQGAYALPLDSANDPSQRRLIQVSRQDDPAAVRFCESVESGHSAQGDSAAIAARLGIVAPPVRLDSQAKYGVVARGEAEIYLRMPTRADYREKIWDHAAGVLIVEEAGGIVTDITGQPLDFQHGRELTANRGVIVTNGRLHDRVLQTLAELGLAK
ncbi:MAG: 3'(2'),5'-bisphosphate nucleotidase [Isosphaeraceae bacterium]